MNFFSLQEREQRQQRAAKQQQEEPMVSPSHAKQNPAGKGARSKAADGRVYFSYAQIHEAITSLANEVQAFKPDIIVAIGGGGFVPARMLRTIVKVPILAVSLELYDDATCTARSEVVRKQWYEIASELGSKVPGG